MESDYYVQFIYYRIPNGRIIPSKGKPSEKSLVSYARGYGFVNMSKSCKPNSKGGGVDCFVIRKEDEKILAEGQSNCSYADNFCYKLGREIALGRAKKQLEKRKINK